MKALFSTAYFTELVFNEYLINLIKTVFFKTEKIILKARPLFLEQTM